MSDYQSAWHEISGRAVDDVEALLATLTPAEAMTLAHAALDALFRSVAAAGQAPMALAAGTVGVILEHAAGGKYDGQPGAGWEAYVAVMQRAQRDLKAAQAGGAQ